MGFLSKLSDIIKRENNIIWNFRFEEDKIFLSCDKEIKAIDSIIDLIYLYNIDYDKKSLILDYENIYDLYFDENNVQIDLFETFSLPELFKGFITIENQNNFGQDKEVFYKYEFEDYDDRYNIKRGNIIKGQTYGELRILQPQYYELIKEIKSYNIDKERREDAAEQFTLLKEIKEKSNKIDLILNKRLVMEETPIIIDKIKVDFKDDGETLELIPILHDNNKVNDDLLNKLDLYDNIKDFYNADIDGKSVRVVIKHKNSLNEIRRNKKITGKDRINFLSRNNPVFQDENIDLSQFGPRVKGFGYLTYRSFSDMPKKNDLDWLDKEIEDSLGQKIDDSKNTKEPIVNIGDEQIKVKPNKIEELEDILKLMNENNEEVAEVTFLNDENKELKTIMNKSQLKELIYTSKNMIVGIDKISDEEELKEIINNFNKYEDELYVPYKNKVVENYGKEAFKERLKNLEEKENHKKQNCLIYDNLDENDYSESDEDMDLNIRNQLKIPEALKEGINLFDYQKECLFKIQKLYLSSKVNGFLLCDDMGLGKTLQLLSFLAWLKERNELKPTLIVAPTSLLNNWDNENGSGEIQKFFKEGFFDSEKIRGKLNEQAIQRLRSRDIVFITYESLRLNDIQLGRIHWNAMICDEAQKIKNPRTLVTTAAKAQNADLKIICSATPVENSLIDLWNLVDYSKPGLLGSLKDFKSSYINKKASKENDYEQLNNVLSDKIEKFYIRREKDILPKTLPKKKIVISKTKMNDIEEAIIDDISTISKEEGNILSAIQKMFIASCHPKLNAEMDIKQLENKQFLKSFIEKSSKLKSLKYILNNVQALDEKAIIFIRSIKLQHIVYHAVKYWFGVNSSIVNGKISDLNKRLSIIEKFKKSNGFNVIILSPEVAGFGLTITEANHVIHYMRMWNPAKEDQATDRAYRIGQTKDVTVYYPILSYQQDEYIEYETINEFVEENINKPDYKISPDEKLNILLARKKNMLMKFFLACCSNEISHTDFNELDSKEEVEITQLSIKDIDKGIIDPFEFEALTAVLFERKGYKTYLTTASNDNGVDVIAINAKEVLFIQCKNVKKINTPDTIKDLLYAKNIYRRVINQNNIKLMVCTNAKQIPQKLQNKEDIEIIDGFKLDEYLIKYNVFKDEIDIKNKDRYSYERLKYEIKYKYNLS